MNLNDLSYRFFDATATRIGLGPLFGFGTTLLIIGAMVLAWRRRGWLPWLLLLAGAALVWLGLLTVSERRLETRLTAIIRVRYNAFSDEYRQAAQVGLIAVPVIGWFANRGRLRMERERKKSLFSSYVWIATKAYYDGDYDRAITDFDIAIRIEPARADCYVKRGLAWTQKGDYDRAVADFDRALVLAPDNAAAYLDRGIVLASRGDHARAILDFDRALALGPNDATPVLHRGLSLAKLGQAAQAAEEFRRVLRITNHSDFVDPARFHLAMIEAQLKVHSGKAVEAGEAAS